MSETPSDSPADAAQPDESDRTPDQAGAPHHQHPGGQADLPDVGAVLGKAVLDVARVLFRQGRTRARKAAEGGRVRLDLRQLRRDRDVMYQKLGREVVHLVDGGEVSHPGLVRGVARIRELEARIDQVEAEAAARLSQVGHDVTQADPGEPTNGDPDGA